MPSVDNIVNGEVTIDSLKHVQVEDILGRDPVVPKESLLKKNIKGKNVLITGAGGSIGSESVANDDRTCTSYNWDTDRHRVTTHVISNGNRIDEPFNAYCFFSSHENPAVVT